MKSIVLLLTSLFATSAVAGTTDSTAAPVNTLVQSDNFSAVPVGDGWTKRYGGSTRGPVSIPTTAELVFVTLSNGQSATFPANASTHQFGSLNYYYGGGNVNCFGFATLGGSYNAYRVYGKSWYGSKTCGSKDNKYKVSYGATINITSVYYK